jgi:hypothetical protein
MRSLLVAAFVVGLSTVGWSDILVTPNDQSNATPIEFALVTNVNFSPLVPVDVTVTYVDKDPNPFGARLAVTQGVQGSFKPLPVGMCDFVVMPGTTSDGCIASAGFVPSNNFQVGFFLYDPNNPTQPDTSSANYWQVTDVSVTPVTTTTTPEPSTASLLLVALGATAWTCRRYRHCGTTKARL